MSILRGPTGRRLFGLWILVAAQVAAGGEAATVVFDFETGDLQGWRVVKGQFGKLVCEPRDVRNCQGKRLLTTLQREKEADKSDRMTGVVESPVFLLQGPDIRLRVGGGRHNQTYVALCTPGGKEWAHARGKNSVAMHEVRWRVPKLVGRKVFLRVVDKHERGWGHVTLDDVRAVGEIDAEATEKRFAAIEEARRAERRARFGQSSRALRLAIADLAATFGDRYPHAKAFLARLEALERRAEDGTAEAPQRFSKQLERLRFEALVANPLVSGQPILYVVRRQYRPDHHNTATLFQTGEINEEKFTGPGALKAIDFSRGSAGRTLVDAPKGVVRDPEVSFDGRRILFAMRRDVEDDYHLYEVHADGSGLQQLTYGAGLSDFDPLYLPDGRIAFSSTREPKYCMCNRHIMGNLFRMDADGANITQIGHSTLFEGHGALTPDGRILYDRWEYVDRNFGDAQGLWMCNPDGSNHALYLMNNTPSPGAVLDARIVPGTQRVIATFSSCHDRPWGALALCDRPGGLEGKSPVLRTWPADAIELVMKGNYDTFKRVKPKYEDPYPLSDKYFLCSRQVRGEQMGIVLLDIFGNEVVLHAEPPGCYDPMPLGPRPRPGRIPDRIDLAEKKGIFYVYDVYRGTGMERVERGAVKYLRVVESPEKRFWTHPRWQGSGTQAPAMAWDDFNNKRILGTAPVEPDGSAHFAVPADRFVYFQLLDEKGMMVQSMRSGTIARPGERTGCVGCHEERLSAVPNAHKAAFSHPADELEPWYGPSRRFSYRTEVQPVFDRYCLRCHDFGKRAAEKLLLAPDLTLAFNVSYMELRRRRLVKVPGAGPARILPPYSWGSHRSKLVDVLQAGHHDVQLDPESFDRIVTWVDINAPYYPEYSSAFPRNLYGRSPLDGRQLKKLSELTGADLTRQSHVPRITFDRPELSPCLANLRKERGPRYEQALAIIRAGKAALVTTPRADLPGSRLTGIDARRQEQYLSRLRAEAEAREAILEGRKVFRGRPSGSR
ncbi:MAG: hypothetical protein ACLF0G_06715 [Candidatus Brocadiia bacterium]